MDTLVKAGVDKSRVVCKTVQDWIALAAAPMVMSATSGPIQVFV